MKVVLINPPTPETFWSFKHVLPFVSKRAAFPPLGVLTVAAMLPSKWEIKVVDMNVERLLDDHLIWADYVMISAMLIHKPAVVEIVGRCRALGKTIIAGGPLFTTGHQDFSQIQHFVLGEAEDVISELIADMEANSLRQIYKAEGWPDIKKVPGPRWDLINLKYYATMAVQFSRGCPFDCEFCDITVINGRAPRTKSPAQLIAELEQLRLRGWKDMVFIVDDNFIGNRKESRALLKELIAWREKTKAGMGFFTEASANLVDDPAMLDLMVRAGFKKVFVGIETPSVEGLEECGKKQNCHRDLAETVRTLQRAGLEIMAGFIVGFDSDKADVFRRQFEFIQRSGVVTAMVGLLNALPQTRLYQRLQKEGRLETESTGNNTQAAINFRTRLSREFLVNGYRDLMRRLYEPHTYYQRICTFLDQHTSRGPRLRLSGCDLRAFFKSFWLLGVWHRGRLAYWKFFITTLLSRPHQFRHAMELAIVGHHFRRVASML